MYTHPLMSFIDHHCAVFDDEDENKLEYTSIHADFKRLVETLLSEFLVEVGVPPARFVQVVADSAGGELNDFVLNSILTVDDFVQFKAMMLRRNVDLTEEVLELHRSRAAAQAAAAAAAAPSSPAPSTPDPAAEHPRRPLWTGPSTTTGSTARLWRRRRRRRRRPQRIWTRSRLGSNETRDAPPTPPLARRR